MGLHKSQQILSDITAYMKYAKYNQFVKRRETFNEIVDRNKQMHIQKFPKLRDEIEDAYKLVYEKKALPSMRSMQFSGKPIDVNPTRIFNCAFVPVDDWRAFSEILFLLLGGTGIGFSVQEHHVEKLPKIVGPRDDRKKRYLVADSIEGWADAVKMLMKSYFYNTPHVEFDYRDIRPKGAKLVTAGGKAPGPEPLKLCIEKVRAIMDRKQKGEYLKPIEVHDIVCHLADAVLAGGIRRAALISLFSKDDREMLSAKTGSWWERNPQRGRANNSAVINRKDITKEGFLDIWEIITNSGSGEPGVYFTNDDTWGTNPCLTGDTPIPIKIDGKDEVIISMKDLVELVQSGMTVDVVSYNTETSENEYKLITMAALTKRNAKLVRVTDIGSGKSIRCTPDHKIYTSNRGWAMAKDLKEDDILVIE